MAGGSEKTDRMLTTGSIIALFIFTSAYILWIPGSCQTSWVLLNVGAGYIIVTDKNRRAYFAKFFHAFVEKRVWGYAFLMLLLVEAGALMGSAAATYMPSYPGPALGGGGNPFVSTPLFVLFLLPMVPLFADAETRLFQSWIIKWFMRRHLVTCRSCGKHSLPGPRCDICGGETGWTGNPDNSLRLRSAIVVSALVFGLAHVLLTWNLAVMAVAIGGYFMARTYVTRGAMFVAKIHMLYDYILLAAIVALYAWSYLPWT